MTRNLRGLDFSDSPTWGTPARPQVRTEHEDLFPLANSDFDSLIRGDESVLRKYPFYPLASPEMPNPGPNFVRFANRLTGDVELPEEQPGKKPKQSKKLDAVRSPVHLDYLYLRALYDLDFVLPVRVGGREIPAKLVPGHLRDYDVVGPMRARVMIIGKHPDREEEEYRRHLSGSGGRVFWDAIDRLGFDADEVGNWYLTTIGKWGNINPSSSTYSKDWIKDCAPILMEELRFVRPDYILCLGADASKFVLGAKCGLKSSNNSEFGVEAMKGRVVPYQIPLHDVGEEPVYHTAHVMTTLSPRAVCSTPEKIDELEVGLAQFRQLVEGNITGRVEDDIDHRVVYKERELAKIVDMILAEAEENPRANIIAVDAEWEGNQPCDPGSYLRTIQFSHRAKFSCCVVLRHPGGAHAFQPGVSYATKQLRRLFCRPEARIGGHFFRADLPWIQEFLNLDLRPYYAPPEQPEATMITGGFDTSLMGHATNETQRFKLEEMALRYTSCPRYDLKLSEWRRQRAHELKKKEEVLLGYGLCPDHILHPYACYDADATRRLFDVLDKMLDCDMYGNACRTAYWVSHSASLAFLEMEQTGLPLDRRRTEDMIKLFQSTRSRLLSELRQEINWPTFNPNSPQQCVAFLFGGDDEIGKRFTHRLKEKTGERVCIVPEGAMTMGLNPLVTTGKRSKAWSDVVNRGEEDLYNPSTDGQTLGILGQNFPLAAKLRDVRFISQILKTILKPPKSNKAGFPVIDELTGLKVYDKGLISFSASDGKVHTRLGQVLETGRASSSNPNLQNIPKRRESEYERIIGRNLYRYPIRSVFKAPPGHVFIEADYTGAELAAIMWMAQDPNGIEHSRRNTLPEDHPDHYDIHSQQAVRCFQLSCEPTKKGLKDSGNKHLRVAAKNVNFGIPYGRGAEAIARQCKEEGVDITTSDAQMLIDAYFNTYPLTYDFLELCKSRVHSPRWMCNAYGRYRRFRWTDDRGVLAEMERQACNFPIQSLVADAVSRALYALYTYRNGFDPEELDYRIALQIHDAVLLQVPVEHVSRVMSEVMPACMINAVGVTPCDLDGNPFVIPDLYRFGIEAEVCVHWGVALKDDESAENMEIDERFRKPVQMAYAAA